MSNTIKRAALGTMQDIPVTSSYDDDAAPRAYDGGTQSPQRSSKIAESVRLNYATGDDYSIDNYSIDAGVNMNSTPKASRGSPSRTIDLSRIGGGGGGGGDSGKNASGMINSASEGNFDNPPRAGSRGSRRMHREALEKQNEQKSESMNPANQEMKSIRKQQLERELELLEKEIQRKRDVIDKTEGEVAHALDTAADAKEEEADALHRQRQTKLAADAEEARRQRERSRTGTNTDDNAQGKNRAPAANGGAMVSVSDDGDGAFDEERKRFEKERNELQEKLEIMEMQNKLLASRVERTETRAKELIKEEERKREAVEQAEQEAKMALVQERAEKTLALSQLEGQARDELEVEKQEKEELERERAKLRAKLAAIEASERDAQATLAAEKTEREELARSLEEQRERMAEAERAQLLTAEQLEEERARREEAIAQLEAEKKALLREQEARHKAIASEKEELRAAMKAMEEEKQALFRKVEDTELRAQEEIQQLELHKVEYELSIRRLEGEKEALDEKMRSVEQESEMVTEAMAEQLAAEKRRLVEDMRKLEAEKTSLATSLDESTARSLRAQEEMTARLQQERADLKKSLEQMEEEKRSLAAHLEQSIKHSREQSKAIQDKTSEEHSQLQQAILRAEREKEEIARRLEENQAKAAREEEEAQAQAQSESQAQAQAEHANAATLQQLEAEREALKASMDVMAREKEEMQRQLKVTEEEARLEREKEVQRSMREKEELRAAVQKMKEELQREKAAAAEANKAAAAAAAAAEKEKEKEGGREGCNDGSQLPHQQAEAEAGAEEEEAVVKALKPSKSLYDMFQEEGPGDSGGPQLPRTLSKALLESPMPHTIDAIAEGDETQEDNIFGVDDSDDWGDAHSMGSKASRASKSSRGKKGHAGTSSGSSSGSGEKKKKNKVEKQPDPFDDLPAPHAAAAGGDLTRLKMLGRLEPSLLSSFDAAHRCPLFYAVAYGQTEVTSFLLEQCPEMVDAVDAHGDSPLHAAASGGSHKCMEMLLETCSRLARDKNGGNSTGRNGSGNSLDSGGPASHHDSRHYGDIANPRNAMSMTPCHLARSPEVVEVLYNFGADLSAQDSNGRSPLFVACAMNREPCADFVINSLDREGRTDDIYEKDRRGDTALHAAACNGSVDCLLLLLQYGVDPTVGNNKNLKAIDLAARNGHVRCRDVLAEYHLHFCTSSEFDSVLFLATLQGHRRVKESEKNRDQPAVASTDMPPTASEEDGGYSIIKKKSSFSLNNGSGGGSPGSDMPKGLKHVQSMFSLKTQKSLRVQRWGEWIAYEDQHTSHIYWYNHSKGAGQWEKPEEVARLQLEAALDGGAGTPGAGVDSEALSPAHSLSPKKSMRLKRHGDWIEYVTETSQTFFYNEKNGEFQWTAPPGVVPRSASKGESTPQQSPSKQQHHQTATPEHALLGNQAASGAMTPEAGTTDTKAPPSSSAVHTDWQPYKDPDSGGIFWYNAVTQVSQWECPLDNVEMVAGEGQGALGANRNDVGDNKGDEDDEEAVEVVGEDDLGI